MPMSLPTSVTLFITALTSVLLLNGSPFCRAQENNGTELTQTDIDLIEFLLNLQFLETEYFLIGSQGYTLDRAAPELTGGGPRPIGARQVMLDNVTRDIIYQFALHGIGHIRAIKNTVPGFPRPLLSLCGESFAAALNRAFDRDLDPPFDPYANSLNYLLALYAVPFAGLPGYVGAIPNLNSTVAKMLVAGLLGVEQGQEAVIRALLYQRASEPVSPYGISVAEFTDRISAVRNSFGGTGVKDEGLYVQQELGPEGLTRGNILAGDQYSLAYARSPQEVLRIEYATGNESLPGGLFPSGASGRIARSYLPQE